MKAIKTSLLFVMISGLVLSLGCGKASEKKKDKAAQAPQAVDDNNPGNSSDGSETPEGSQTPQTEFMVFATSQQSRITNGFGSHLFIVKVLPMTATVGDVLVDGKLVENIIKTAGGSVRKGRLTEAEIAKMYALKDDEKKEIMKHYANDLFVLIETSYPVAEVDVAHTVKMDINVDDKLVGSETFQSGKK